MINVEKIKEVFSKKNIVLKKTILPIIVSGTLLFSGCSIEKKDIFEQLEEDGITVETMDINPEYAINRVIKFDNKDVIENYDDAVSFEHLCTPSEFSEYTGEYNLTWNDIRNTLNEIEIDDSIKTILLDGINNLEKKNFNINLAVLNYNLKNLKVEYSDEENLSYCIDILAEFKFKTQTVVIYDKENEKLDEILVHEILGHGMTIAYIPDKKVYCSTYISVLNINDDIVEETYIGKSFDEAVVSLITCCATGKKMDSYFVYINFTYMFLLLCNSNGVNIDDYANYGVEYLINKMKDNNLEYDVNIIELLDFKFNCLLVDNGDSEYTFEDLCDSYLCDIMNNEINTCGNCEVYRNKMHNFINCYKAYLKPDTINDLTCFVFSNDNTGDYICIDNLNNYVDDYIDTFIQVQSGNFSNVEIDSYQYSYKK